MEVTKSLYDDRSPGFRCSVDASVPSSGVVFPWGHGEEALNRPRSRQKCHLGKLGVLRSRRGANVRPVDDRVFGADLVTSGGGNRLRFNAGCLGRLRERAAETTRNVSTVIR